MISLILVSFMLTGLQVPPSYAQELYLPKPGVRVGLSPEFKPAVLSGLKINVDNPFKFEFILNTGDSQQEQLSAQGGPASGWKSEANRLIKYFLAGITVPEKDLWVNLSPYEKDRIVPDAFGKTEMGRDLLAQDYLLKQITASLMYPDDETGKRFWKRIYEEAAKKYGNTKIPVNTFNKVWIVPAKASVYENAKAGTAYVVESKLKVMLETDYLSQNKNTQRQPVTPNQDWQKQIIRDIIIPELTKEVNEGKNFAQLRQVYNSLILATWYKKKIKESLLSKAYADRNKIKGVEYDRVIASDNEASTRAGSDLGGKQSFSNVEGIYQNYLKAFKKGVCNLIREEVDITTGQTVPRKYFSGGLDFAKNTTGAVGLKELIEEATAQDVSTQIDREKDKAMSVSVDVKPATRKGGAINESELKGLYPNLNIAQIQNIVRIGGLPKYLYRAQPDIKYYPILPVQGSWSGFLNQSPDIDLLPATDENGNRKLLYVGDASTASAYAGLFGTSYYLDDQQTLVTADSLPIEEIYRRKEATGTIEDFAKKGENTRLYRIKTSDLIQRFTANTRILRDTGQQGVSWVIVGDLTSDVPGVHIMQDRRGEEFFIVDKSTDKFIKGDDDISNLEPAVTDMAMQAAESSEQERILFPYQVTYREEQALRHIKDDTQRVQVEAKLRIAQQALSGVDVNEKNFAQELFGLEHVTRAQALIDLASQLRMSFDYLQDTDNKPPLEYAIATGQYFKIGERLYITPTTESFRRHMIFKTDEQGRILFAHEFMIPGDHPAKYDVQGEKREAVATTINQLFRNHPYSVDVKSMPDLPYKGKMLYGKEWNGKNIEVAIYSYRIDGKRLSHLTKTLTENMAKEIGVTNQQIEEMIIQQSIECFMAAREVGYLGIMDMHPENIRVGVDHVRKKLVVQLVGDFGSFMKISSYNKGAIPLIAMLSIMAAQEQDMFTAITNYLIGSVIASLGFVNDYIYFFFHPTKQFKGVAFLAHEQQLNMKKIFENASLAVAQNLPEKRWVISRVGEVVKASIVGSLINFVVDDSGGSIDNAMTTERLSDQEIQAINSAWVELLQRYKIIPSRFRNVFEVMFKEIGIMNFSIQVVHNNSFGDVVNEEIQASNVTNWLEHKLQEGEDLSRYRIIALTTPDVSVVDPINSELLNKFEKDGKKQAAEILEYMDLKSKGLVLGGIVKFRSGYSARFEGNVFVFFEIAKKEEVLSVQLNSSSLETLPFIGDVSNQERRDKQQWLRKYEEIFRPFIVSLRETDLIGQEVAHGTIKGFRKSVMSGPKNIGKGMGGKGLYVDFISNENASVARDFAEKAAKHSSIRMKEDPLSFDSALPEANQTAVLRGNINNKPNLRVLKIFVDGQGVLKDSTRLRMNPKWADDPNMQEAALKFADILDIRLSNLAIEAERILVFHESAGADSIQWNDKAMNIDAGKKFKDINFKEIKIDDVFYYLGRIKGEMRHADVNDIPTYIDFLSKIREALIARSEELFERSREIGNLKVFIDLVSRENLIERAAKKAAERSGRRFLEIEDELYPGLTRDGIDALKIVGHVTSFDGLYQIIFQSNGMLLPHKSAQGVTFLDNQGGQAGRVRETSRDGYRAGIVRLVFKQEDLKRAGIVVDNSYLELSSKLPIPLRLLTKESKRHVWDAIQNYLEALGEDFNLRKAQALQALGYSSEEELTKDLAIVSVQTKKDVGGIDLTADQMNVQVQGDGAEMKFNITPEMIKQFETADGIEPEITEMTPLIDVKSFLGLSLVANNH